MINHATISKMTFDPKGQLENWQLKIFSFAPIWAIVMHVVSSVDWDWGLPFKYMVWLYTYISLSWFYLLKSVILVANIQLCKKYTYDP